MDSDHWRVNQEIIDLASYTKGVRRAVRTRHAPDREVSQIQLAQRANVSPAAVNKIERAYLVPGKAVAQALRAALDKLADESIVELPEPYRNPGKVWWDLYVLAYETERPSRLRTPFQLPAAGRHSLLGRQLELAQLDKILDPEHSAQATPIALLDGPVGVGKTTLAVDWVERKWNQGYYQGGVCLVELDAHKIERRGGFAIERDPKTPAEVAYALLQDFDVHNIPEDPEARVRLLRSTLARKPRRQRLLILDDAETADQIIPLLPPRGSGCAVIVTTRRRDLVALELLHGAARVPVQPLDRPAAIDLLDQQMTLQPNDRDTLAAIADACDGIPLALHAAALAARTRPLPLLREQLRQPHTVELLSSVVGGNPAVELATQIDLSLRRVPAESRELLRHLTEASHGRIDLADAAYKHNPQMQRCLLRLHEENLLWPTLTGYSVPAIVRDRVLADDEHDGRAAS